MKLTKLADLKEFIKANLKILIDFLNSHSIEISVKQKSTEEVSRQLKINNLFMFVVIALLLWLIFIFSNFAVHFII